MTTMNKEAACV